MKTVNEQINDLKIILKMYRDAYSLQNNADVILYNHFILDEDCKYLDNDFYKIKSINSSSPLYYKECETIKLITNLEILINPKNLKQ